MRAAREIGCDHGRAADEPGQCGWNAGRQKRNVHLRKQDDHLRKTNVRPSAADRPIREAERSACWSRSSCSGNRAFNSMDRIAALVKQSVQLDGADRFAREAERSAWWSGTMCFGTGAISSLGRIVPLRKRNVHPPRQTCDANHTTRALTPSRYPLRPSTTIIRATVSSSIPARRAAVATTAPAAFAR